MPPYKRKFSYTVAPRKRARIAVAPGGGRRMARIPKGPYRSGGFYGPQYRSAAERKVVNGTIATVDVNVGGSVTLLNGVATGTDFTDRIGRKIVNKSVQIRGLLTPDTSATTITTNLCRIMIIEDLQTNGVAPSISDIFHEAVSTSMLNLNNRNRFKVHFDKEYVLGPFNSTANSIMNGCPSAYAVNIYKNINVETVFEGTAATVGSISEGALFLVTLGNSAAGSTDAKFGFSSRVRFIDA